MYTIYTYIYTYIYYLKKVYFIKVKKLYLDNENSSLPCIIYFNTSWSECEILGSR